jgi:hypothetical protein
VIEGGPTRTYKLVDHDRRKCKHEEFEHGWEGCLGTNGKKACACPGHWIEEHD